MSACPVEMISIGGAISRKGEAKLREQIVQTYVRRLELDVAAEEVLREIVSQCSRRSGRQIHPAVPCRDHARPADENRAAAPPARP